MQAIDSPMRGSQLLRRLNLFGLGFLDPIVLAALADERPLLLIGPHGTAKSELLNRVAATLKLEHRHFNASLISFDDLLGYPVPDAKRNAIRYLRTPGDLWDAECVFLDEISRCRPETQNKLFSVIHEKRVQGLALPKLRYRWAAMNPPLTADSDPEESYEGSLPLDPALADRFAYVVELPALADLAPADRIALIGRGGAVPDSPPDLRALVERTRQEISATSDADRAWTAKYVDALVQPFVEAKLAISGRRAVMLADGIVSVRAAWPVARQASGTRRLRTRHAACWIAAARAGPHHRGIEVDRYSPGCRAGGWRAGGSADAPHRGAPDPVARVARALRLYGKGVEKTELSTLVSEAFAQLTVPRRYLFARHVLRLAAACDGLNAPAYALLGEPMAKVATLSRRRSTRSPCRVLQCRSGTSCPNG